MSSPAVAPTADDLATTKGDFLQPDVQRGQYFLTHHTFVTVVDETMVVLDLRNDDYLCIEPRYTPALKRLLGLPPGALESGDDADLSRDIDQLVEEMLGAELLTRDHIRGKPATLIRQAEIVHEMPRSDIGVRRKITLTHVVRFIRAYVVSNILLRSAPIERVAARVTSRRLKGTRPIDCEQAGEIVEIYRRLRPLIWSRKDRCLLNSLSLIEFLASFGIYPSWYFGVRLREFAAHCWVQEGDLALDDDAENIHGYSVIMRA